MVFNQSILEIIPKMQDIHLILVISMKMMLTTLAVVLY